MFNRMNEANEKGELIGHVCNFHLRRDGQVTVHEIIVEKALQGQGIGTAMINQLKKIEGATSIFAKCPFGLSSNGWYAHIGFTREGVETTKSGSKLNLWRLKLC